MFFYCCRSQKRFRRTLRARATPAPPPSCLGDLRPLRGMFLTEVIIDGFKSYSQRTVVSGWDHEFNAITGLNGSGKSNILDAICFVLGISNLSQVRAASLQDLIYKQGQAGVTKATVTLVFNNSDPKTSPVGQELCETISVTRQVRWARGSRRGACCG